MGKDKGNTLVHSKAFFDYLWQSVFKNSGNLSLEQKYSFIIDLLRGLDYLHKNNTVHRDLKPENILLNEDLVAKIMDPWMLFHLRDKYDPWCDMYSVGMIIWAIMNREHKTP